MPDAPLPDPRFARRGFLLATAAFLAGCATSSQTSSLPDGQFPGGRYDQIPPRPVPRPTPAPAPPPKPVEAGPWTGGVVPRARWAKAGPEMGNINPLTKVRYITVHHEGWDPFWATDFAETAERVERVRVGHRNAKNGGYADIGYHFIVDREGRVWEGRSLRFQGAHVKARNEGNIGIMCLGNFEQQAPTEKQLAGLAQQVKAMRAKYNIPVQRVYTHQEWPDSKTLCPGRTLQTWVERQRRVVFA